MAKVTLTNGKRQVTSKKYKWQVTNKNGKCKFSLKLGLLVNEKSKFSVASIPFWAYVFAFIFYLLLKRTKLCFSIQKETILNFKRRPNLNGKRIDRKKKGF